LNTLIDDFKKNQTFKIVKKKLVIELIMQKRIKKEHQQPMNFQVQL